MVLEKLGVSLKNTLQKIVKSVFVDEKLINELIKEIQKALLASDVNVKLVFDLTKKIKERALKEETPDGLTKKEHLVNIVYEELVQFLGGEGNKIEIKKKPYKIMLVGLFGNGKTTTAGKLAKFFQKRGSKTALVGLDIYRPAAMEQLEQIAKQVKTPVFIDKKTKDAVKIWKGYEEDLEKKEVLIIDTAGRDALSDDLIYEIKSLKKAVKPDEVLLVIGADVGQAAEKQAKAFHDSCGVTGVVITKMDGTAKGGGALIACSVSGAPVKFIGVGEKLDALEEFKPKGFVGRLLGMGDLEALLEKVKDVISEEEAQDLGKKLLKGEFNLIDLYEQMSAMKKMGPLSKVMEMIPGMGQVKMPKEALDVQEKKLVIWHYIMNSMTKSELEDPDKINSSRIERVAKGSACSVKEVRELLKQYKQSKKMMKMMKGEKGMEKMMKKMSGGKLKFKA